MVDRESRQAVDLLLVEDNPGDVRLIEEAFTEAHLANPLHVTTDGEEALDFVYRRNQYADAPRPDIVLLDWYLPGTDGEEVLATLKEDEDLRAIPVVVLTGSEAVADQAKSYDLQANAYLTKPVDSDEFVDVICSFREFWLNVVRLPDGDDN